MQMKWICSVCVCNTSVSCCIFQTWAIGSYSPREVWELRFEQSIFGITRDLWEIEGGLKGHIKRGIESPKKTIIKSIRNFLEMNELNLNMVYDKTLLDNFIHAVDVTLWNKTWLLCCSPIRITSWENKYL